ncbi:MAG: hypothetical protein LBI12_05810, partial [Treponema sp.]|nr:hypothetical protein [Treponema sp.]
MLKGNSNSRYGRKIYILRRFYTITAVLFIILAVIASVFIAVQLKNGISNEKRELLHFWNTGDFKSAYEITKNALIQNPVDYFLLTINGFSAYQMGISQINNQNMLNFINESIFSLRKALIFKEAANDGRIFYVLGKAYVNKGKEYSELAVKYLEIAHNMSYEAHDIPEYLGLAYAASGDYRSSVEAFSRAFVSDALP